MKLDRETVKAWPSGLLASGWRVLAPVTVGEQVEYRELTSEAAQPTGLGKGLARQSPKTSWFPRSEPILKFQRNNREWTVADPPLEFPPVVVFGARPCDAAAAHILAPVFGWDFHDPFFERRRKNLVFVVLACREPADSACFCTSVGIDPAGENSGDVVLTELADGAFAAEACTESGRKLLAALPRSDEPVALTPMRDEIRRKVPVRFSPKAVADGLRQRSKDPLWERATRPCLGCGTCSFVCPTCHCFDLQDEVRGREGVRQKNWDACAFPLFTLHTSGHNPRPDQPSRWRQRLSHKFSYYPEKFGRVLCTGCGRCLRLCPAGMDLVADLTELARELPVAPRVEIESTGGLPGIQASTASASPNIYRPYLMRIAALRDETPDVRTLRLEFVDAKEGEAFNFRVGQFGLYSALGEGEATFCIASSSTRKGYLECTFRQAGRVTRALRRLNVGDLMGFRGPYGNSFPVESWRGKDLLFIAGGIALPPMRSVIQYCLDHRPDYGDITIIYGAKTWSDHVYKEELAEWEARPDVKLWLCVDWKGGPKGLIEEAAEDDWRPLNLKSPGDSLLDRQHRRYTGFVPQLVEAARPSAANRVAVLCGPPIMIKFTLQSLKKLGFESGNVFTTLE
ncbi:MAG TPA: 4Fe-4S dicluster domain-containing protein, partial [Candidatus Acidoferrales bacterium]|nr:4Fe-4S dicluster domain-containing protein [Candidatus Acidoferrales bacterium]